MDGHRLGESYEKGKMRRPGSASAGQKSAGSMNRKQREFPHAAPHDVFRTALCSLALPIGSIFLVDFSC
jgi:hypothetical protein